MKAKVESKNSHYITSKLLIKETLDRVSRCQAINSHFKIWKERFASLLQLLAIEVLVGLTSEREYHFMNIHTAYNPGNLGPKFSILRLATIPIISLDDASPLRKRISEYRENAKPGSLIISITFENKDLSFLSRIMCFENRIFDENPLQLQDRIALIIKLINSE